MLAASIGPDFDDGSADPDSADETVATPVLDSAVMDRVKSWLGELGLGAQADMVVALTATVAVLALSAVAYFITKQIVLRLVRSGAKRSHTTWDDALVDLRAFQSPTGADLRSLKLGA